MQLKNSGNSYVIPFELPFLYVAPQVDNVGPDRLVAPVDIPQQVESVEEAIDLYLAAFREQFMGVHGADRKRWALSRFLAYLQAQNHSLRLAELTVADGEAFLDSLHHAYTDMPMSLQTSTRYKSALRSFSRFLFHAELMQEDVFFALKAQ